jgi:hypothetical protein
MKLLLFLACLIYFFSCTSSDRLRPALQAEIEKLKKEKELGYNDSAAIAFLKDSCSSAELITLTTNATPIIRILAYRAMVNRDDGNYFTILKNHLSDTAKVMWWFYDDAAGEFTIADLMISKAEMKLSRLQKDTLIDLVLKQHIYLQAARWMMADIGANEKYYAIIKEQAQIQTDSTHDTGLILAVAKYKKAGDIPFIRSGFSVFCDNSYCNNNIFTGIEYFPDSSFFVLLQQYFDNYIVKEKQSSYDDLEIYCRAVAQYKSAAALKILHALTKSATYPDTWYLPHNKEFVFKAIYRYNCSLYKGLYDQLKPVLRKDIVDDEDTSVRYRPATW